MSAKVESAGRTPQPMGEPAAGSAWRERHKHGSLRLPRPFAIPRFDHSTESRFWQERHAASLLPLKSALLLGAGGFFAFVILDVCTKGISPAETAGRCLVVFALLALFFRLQRDPAPLDRIGIVARLAACLSALDLAGTLLADGNPEFYAEAWPGLLPIYFFTYGQMVMSVFDSVLFGWTAMAMLILTGYAIDAGPESLLPSLIILLIVNIFGLCTRCQLEASWRNSFRERRKAEQAADDKARFLRHIGHNLRQPLQALSCYSSVLDEALADDSGSELQLTAKKLGTSIDDLNEAFNRILDWSNLETGKQQPVIAAIAVNPMLAALEAQFAPQAAKRGLKLRVRLRQAPPFNVRSDGTLLRQILGNLLDNAIKYTKSGWILLGTVRSGPGRLTFHVRDTGIGIAEQQHDRVFQEFYRGHRRRDDPSAQGLGIGLAFARGAADRLPDHTLRFQSRPSRGTDFFLHLPSAANCGQGVPAASHHHGELAGSFVLLVDNDSEVLNALALQLNRWGCLVQKAASLHELRQALDEALRPPDLLITDFYLDREATAHDVIAAVADDCGPVPTVILSARAIAHADKARWPATTRLLRKPVGPALLLETLLEARETGVFHRPESPPV